MTNPFEHDHRDFPPPRRFDGCATVLLLGGLFTALIIIAVAWAGRTLA